MFYIPYIGNGGTTKNKNRFGDVITQTGQIYYAKLKPNPKPNRKRNG